MSNDKPTKKRGRKPGVSPSAKSKYEPNPVLTRIKEATKQSFDKARWDLDRIHATRHVLIEQTLKEADPAVVPFEMGKTSKETWLQRIRQSPNAIKYMDEQIGERLAELNKQEDKVVARMNSLTKFYVDSFAIPIDPSATKPTNKDEVREILKELLSAKEDQLPKQSLAARLGLPELEADIEEVKANNKKG